MNTKKSNKEKSSKRNIIKSQEEFDLEIASCIEESWPLITQKNIANKLHVSQPFISKRLQAWSENKNTAPIELVLRKCRNTELETRLRETYKLDDAIVYKSSYIDIKNDIDRAGKHGANFLIKKINDICETKELNNYESIDTNETKATEITINTSCGRGVFAVLQNLVNELENTDVKLKFSCNIALRSNSLIENTPIQIISRLSNYKNIEVKHAYQFPEIYEEKLEDLIAERIKMQKKLAFEQKLLDSDIAILGLGSITKSSSVTGFMHMINHFNMQNFFDEFDIIGEIAFQPFNSKGFLFHHLIKEVFKELDENSDFRPGKDEYMKRLEKFAINTEAKLSVNDFIDISKFVSSIFTLNFCKILNTKDKKPYVLLVVGGERQKTKPLKWILNYLKDKDIKGNKNFINGVVTNEYIAEDLKLE